MTALAQGTTGLALVMAFGLLVTNHVRLQAILLLVQSASVATTALAQQQPLVSAATIIVDVIGASWLLWQVPPFAATTGVAQQIAPGSASGVSSVKFGILTGVVMAVLSESCGVLSLPLAIVLLSIVLAATRMDVGVRLIALVSLQNGLTIAACLDRDTPLPGLAVFFLAMPFALSLPLAPRLAGLAQRDNTLPGWTIPAWTIPAWIRTRFGYTQLTVCAGLLAATLLVPLDPIGAVFAPLIAAWGVAEAWTLRDRTGLTLVWRSALLTRLVFMLLAVSSAQPVIAWFCVLAAVTAALLPTLRRRPQKLVLASCAAGLALFGFLTLPDRLTLADLSTLADLQPVLSHTTLFLGYAMLAAVVPDLAVVVVILTLRLVVQTHLPAVAGNVLIGIAMAGLLASLMVLRHSRHRATLVQLSHAAIAAVALGLDVPQARFAAVVLLILLILTRAAVRLAPAARGAASTVAAAALGGVPPFGVFPGLVLTLLAIGSHAPWLLLPVGGALAIIAAASLPRDLPLVSRAGIPSSAWMPLALTLVFGLFSPPELTRWLQSVIIGMP